MTTAAATSASRPEYAHLGQVAVEHYARGVALVTMRGEHDLATQPVLAHALGIAAAHSNVIVDLTECSFIDSTVISEFIKSSETVRASGDQVMLVIPREQTQVARIAHLTGLAHLFELHDSKEAALARLGTRNGELAP
jgi:anti-sigma B factor antagonist